MPQLHKWIEPIDREEESQTNQRRFDFSDQVFFTVAPLLRSCQIH